MAHSGWQLHERVRKRQVALVRRLNDHHIFVTEVMPLLVEAKTKLEVSTRKTDREYPVPSRKKAAVARRTDSELKSLYSSFITRELFGTLLIGIVSLTESFLLEALRLVIRAHPHKLGISIQGTDTQRYVPIATVLRADDLDELIEELIEDRIHSISYASPRDYLEFFHRVTGVETGDSAFSQYIEIKATRDLLVHNSGKVNAIYLAKVGKSKRASLNAIIPITSEYFDHAIATLKRISILISDGVRETFTRQRRDDDGKAVTT